MRTNDVKPGDEMGIGVKTVPITTVRALHTGASVWPKWACQLVSRHNDAKDCLRRLKRMFREDKEHYLLDSVEKMSPPLNPVFKLAVAHGVLASIRLHISRNDVLDARDETGQTPLMIAARKNRAEACRLLLDAGADRSLVDMNGFTAQDLARAAGAQDALAVFALPAA